MRTCAGTDLFVVHAVIWHDDELHPMGLRSRDSAHARPCKRHSCRNFSKLALEFLRRHDYSYAAQFVSMEGLSDLHVPELLIHPTSRKSTSSIYKSTSADTLYQYFCYPETANLTLEEVDWLFYQGDVVKHSRRVAKEGWDKAEGAEPEPGILETGRAGSSKKGADEAEKYENRDL
jgi:hypothetical protein